MASRRNRPGFITTIPEGWTAHDGRGCPIDPQAMPGLLFRSGSAWRVGTRSAASWGTMWTWDAKRPGLVDIVAYRFEEPASVAPRQYRVWCGKKLYSGWLPTRVDAWNVALAHGLAFPDAEGEPDGLGPLTWIEVGQPDPAEK